MTMKKAFSNVQILYSDKHINPVQIDSLFIAD